MESTTHPTALPELPDIETLIRDATAVRDHYRDQITVMQAKLDQADTYLERLTGKPAKRLPARPGARHKSMQENTYRDILGVLSRDSWLAINTISGRSHFSRSHCNFAMNEAVKRGHATASKHGQKYRYLMTEVGEDFLTGPDGADS